MKNTEAILANRNHAPYETWDTAVRLALVRRLDRGCVLDQLCLKDGKPVWTTRFGGDPIRGREIVRVRPLPVVRVTLSGNILKLRFSRRAVRVVVT